VGSGGEVVYREWAPNAKEVYLIGDFSERLAFGIHLVTITDRQPQMIGTEPLIP